MLLMLSQPTYPSLSLSLFPSRLTCVSVSVWPSQGCTMRRKPRPRPPLRAHRAPSLALTQTVASPRPQQPHVPNGWGPGPRRPPAPRGPRHVMHGHPGHPGHSSHPGHGGVRARPGAAPWARARAPLPANAHGRHAGARPGPGPGPGLGPGPGATMHPYRLSQGRVAVPRVPHSAVRPPAFATPGRPHTHRPTPQYNSAGPRPPSAARSVGDSFDESAAFDQALLAAEADALSAGLSSGNPQPVKAPATVGAPAAPACHTAAPLATSTSVPPVAPALPSAPAAATTVTAAGTATSLPPTTAPASSTGANLNNSDVGDTACVPLPHRRRAFGCA